MDYVICFGISAILTYIWAHISIKIADKFAFYDIPKKRNIHDKPIPMLGGLALLMSILISTYLCVNETSPTFFLCITGAIGMFIIGILDDRFNFSPWWKIVLQMVVISYVFNYGIRIDYLSIPLKNGAVFFSSEWSFILTQIWMLTVINMFNLIDGIDGLATGISCISAGILFLVSLAVSPSLISMLLVAIVGATFMFLKFNFFPAKIFLGDSGSLLLGYLFAFVSIVGVMKTTTSFLVLVFVFSIPLMDLVLSVIRRMLKKKSIFKPDLLHIHHQLVRRGLSVKQAVLLLYGIGFSFGMLTLVIVTHISMLNIIMGMLCFIIVLSYFIYLQMSQKRFKFEKRR
mgnify:CR=1 FL=1|tara:strand:+ start:184 stop:1215 length:1032 start_codon:yes stop_codon:yes gene_type:complete